MLHIECDKGHSKLIKGLVEVANDEGLFEWIWDKQVHPSQVVNNDLSVAELRCLTQWSQCHTNFCSSMYSKDLVRFLTLMPS